MLIRKAYQIIDSEPPMSEVPNLYSPDAEIPLQIHATVASDGIRYEASIALTRLIESPRDIGAYICAGAIDVDPGDLGVQKFVGIVHPDHGDSGSAILYTNDRRSKARIK